MSTTEFLHWARNEVDKLSRSTLLRSAQVRDLSPLSFASNDYLNLRSHPEVISAVQRSVERYGLGSGSSRVLSGTLPPHQNMERVLAEYFGRESCVVFSSGYLANLGCLSAIAGRSDRVFADRLCHASLLDAAKLSGARLMRFHHNDVGQLREMLRDAKTGGRRFIVTETIFSMDGDAAPLDELAAVAAEYDAMIVVDDAHAGGVFGGGRGLAAGHENVICTGTLSKAFAAYGGFVTGPSELRPLFISSSRTFLFNTSLPPCVLDGALAALTVMKRDPQRGEELLRRAAEFRALLRAGGFDTMGSCSQIIPILIGDAARAVELSARLERRGVFAPAIRRPTVPAGTERLRLSVTLEHSRDDLRNAAEILLEEGQALGVVR